MKSNVEDTCVENCTLPVGQYILLLQLMPFEKVIVVYYKLTQIVHIIILDWGPVPHVCPLDALQPV
jgi:hypothetical protein